MSLSFPTEHKRDWTRQFIDSSGADNWRVGAKGYGVRQMEMDSNLRGLTTQQGETMKISMKEDQNNPQEQSRMATQ